MTDSAHRLDVRPAAGEAIAVAICAALTATIVISALWGRVGALAPAAVLVMAVVALVAATAWLIRFSTKDIDRALLAGAAITFVAAAACLVYLAWPSMLLPGRGSELTHHLMLIDFIERTWRLPDASLASAMREMAAAPPGLHLLAALLGNWIGRDGFRAVYLVVAFAVALKLTLVFCIAAREFAGSRGRTPLAAAATLLCVLPSGFVLGSFVHDSSLARVTAELFVTGMWWTVLLWDPRPSRSVAALFALLGAGAFLTWPASVWPAIVTLIAVMATARNGTVRERLEQLIVASVPIGLVVMLHRAAGGGWRVDTGVADGSLQSAFDAFTGLLFVTGAIGAIVAVITGRSRVTLLLALSTLMHASTAWLIESGRSGVPSATLEMLSASIYPLAVLGAGAFAVAAERVAQITSTRAAAWILALVAAVVAGMSLARFPMPRPVVSHDLYQAGRWVRANLDPACVDYLVPERDTMYWLHVAVLGNGRSSLRAANPATFDPAQARQRWLELAGLPFAIGYLPEIPHEVLEEVDVLERFGAAAVISRRGPSTCDDARRLAGGVAQTR